MVVYNKVYHLNNPKMVILIGEAGEASRPSFSPGMLEPNAPRKSIPLMIGHPGPGDPGWIRECSCCWLMGGFLSSKKPMSRDTDSKDGVQD